MIKITPLEQMNQRANKVADVLKVMAHPGRLLLLCMLYQESLTVTELEKKLGMSQSQISQCLQKLEHMQLVHFEREGKLKHYYICDEKIKKLISHLYEIYNPKEHS